MTAPRVHPDSGATYIPVPRAGEPHVRVRDLALLEFAGPDTDTARHFFTQFGLKCQAGDDGSLEFSAEAGATVCLVYRQAARAKFIGPTFAVATLEELDEFSARAGTAAPAPLALPGHPPGVAIADPNGVVVKVAYFEAWRPLPSCGEQAAVNRADERPRINAPRRPPRIPSRVLRLGHMVLGTPEWEATARFYIDHFGFIPSDVQALPDGRPAVAFLRCDRGDEPTDHHTFVIARLPVVDFEHAAFEVPDLDAVGMGGQVLREGGFRHAWGIGRHMLGSQIFDYWFGPDGRKFEHFADGDLFDAARPTRYHAMSAAGLSQWGPPAPVAFLRPRLGWREVLELVRNLAGSFGFREIRLMMSAMRSKSLPD
jgi:catechol 2,3-dioxygenase-like lactoylglutathione lyase family enzyme